MPSSNGSPSAIDPIPLALGQGSLDRRADLRTGSWAGVPGPWRLIAVDPAAEALVRRDGSVATLVEVDPSTAPAGLDVLLGVGHDGRAVVGRVVDPSGVALAEGVAWAGLRSVGLRLPAEERTLLAELVALASWHRTHTHCPRCGTPTEVAGLGWWRTCPADGSDHYPRTDPAVIAVLVDAAGNALLARQAVWPEGAFSALAGFVEPGESAERAVVREIAEEVGLTPTAVRYVASQPWPFPGSLMLGFEASVEGVRPTPEVDGIEIVEARWLSPGELPGLAEAREVRLPGRLSIAHQLVRRWYGGEIPDAWCRW